jgi:endo-alpha-N-acetylgalactosaminidase
VAGAHRKWTDNEIQFTGDVRVTDAAGQRQIFKGDRMILDGNAYLLPWEPKTEKKLYHWNADGGTTTWTLPTAWKAETIKQYRLTDTGRVFVADLPVVNGQVTINAETKTPYVIYRSKAKADRKAKWGQGGVVKDPGFNDRDRGDWIVKGVVDAVSVDVDNHGRSALKVAPCRIKTAVFQKITGLKSGVYSASVWVEVQEGRRKASLTISPDGGTPETVWTDHSFVNNAVGNSEWNRTRMQRMRVLFEVPSWKRSATITLAVEPGESSVRFDNVRIVPTVRTERVGFDVFEDFENVDEGWFPFVKGGAGGVTDPTTHLSELHAPYTNAGWNEKLVDDTIEGQWSLKSHNERNGLVYQTLPQTVRFVPGRKYEVSFDYQSAFEGEYVFVIGSGGGDDQKIISKTPFTQQRQTKRFTVTVTPGDDPNVWVGLERIRTKDGVKSKEIDFIMDNFAVRQLDQ